MAPASVCLRRRSVLANQRRTVPLLQLNGHPGVISAKAPDTMTSYFPPAVLGYVSETTDLFMKNRTDFISTRFLLGTGEPSIPLTSYGGQWVRIYGMHFGRVNLTWGVRAWCVDGVDHWLSLPVSMLRSPTVTLSPRCCRHWPESNPNATTFATACEVVVDHFEMWCLTVPSSGGNVKVLQRAVRPAVSARRDAA